MKQILFSFSLYGAIVTGGYAFGNPGNQSIAAGLTGLFCFFCGLLILPEEN